ncbi:phospholipase D-like domain-containing protein [Bifidobacterium moukalabense]|uniref:phospholipase D-like domain-containing protein n=1 Tax=Bifidobacterium moukalabense TaxID=1333651 RepID=UPI0010F4A80A|nr:phospholipase D-like domain-containing protein [Bifidobacterium moukalabense]
MELLTQPFNGSLGNRLKELLRSGKFNELNIAVAFAKNSGILRLINDFDDFLENGGKINAYIGVDLGGTSYEALTALLPRTTSLHIIHAETTQSFHSKMYNFVGEDEELLIVGSNNLTGGGLWTNLESSLIISIDHKDNAPMQERFYQYIENLESLDNSCMSIKEQEDIDRLLQNGYIEKEVFTLIQQNSKKNKDEKNTNKLFGDGKSTQLPRLKTQSEPQTSPSPQKPEPVAALNFSIPASRGGDTIWFEARAMTGGSRNILDLSMKSLLISGNPQGTAYDIGESNYMSGAVKFFGIDPTNTLNHKDITINYNGIDYNDNTILFPEGSKANGTWRLQIKGKDASGNKITEVLNLAGRPYLPHKIISFTKIKDDYYFMSVFSESQLNFFKKASWLLAFNGSTEKARQMGIIRND